MCFPLLIDFVYTFTYMLILCCKSEIVRVVGSVYMAPAHWGLGEIDGLLVPPGKASNLLTDHLIAG